MESEYDLDTDVMLSQVSEELLSQLLSDQQDLASAATKLSTKGRPMFGLFGNVFSLNNKLNV